MSVSQISSPKSKIMLVDDDEDLLTVMQLSLTSEGFEVSLSANAINIYKLLRDSPPDLILLDITMNGVSGEDICIQIKKDVLTNSIPVLFFSADRDIAEIAELCQADGFVRKPSGIKDLAEMIRSHLPIPT